MPPAAAAAGAAGNGHDAALVKPTALGRQGWLTQVLRHATVSRARKHEGWLLERDGGG